MTERHMFNNEKFKNIKVYVSQTENNINTVHLSKLVMEKQKAAVEINLLLYGQRGKVVPNNQ